MGEEAFDEVIIPCEDGMVLHVTGGPSPHHPVVLPPGRRATHHSRRRQTNAG